MKIKLILAASLDDPLRKNDPFMPLSLPILAGTAPQHDYSFVDLLWEDDPGLNDRADLVGISVRYSAENRAYELAREFKKKGAMVVLGGPQITSVPFRAKQFADAVAVGEGENLWPVITADAEKNQLRDFYVCSPEPFKAPGYSVYQVRSYPDLQKNTMPLRHIYKKKYRFDTIFSTRGCPVDCDFCSVASIFGKQFRSKPVDDVIAEINSFKNYYYILDDTVFGKPSTYDYYLELYTKITSLKKKRYWTGQGTLDAAASEKGRLVIQRAAESGLLYVAVGMESINHATLEKSGALRKMGVASNDDALARMKEHIRFIQDQGIIVSGWFVIGYEDDSIETYYDTLKFCLEMNIIPVIFPVTALPGTRLYNRLKNEGKLDVTKKINFINPSIKDEEVSKALKYIAHAGFTPAQIYRNIRFYLPRFKTDRTHKSIFLWILQSNLKSGIGIASDVFTS